MAGEPLDPAVLDLEPFELLASVIELGSLSAAAARHGVSQPAVSARMRTLERRVGVPLLLRTPSGSVPTAEGAIVARAASHVLRHATALARDIRELRVVRGGVLRVAASLTIAEHLLPGWLARLRAQAVDLKVELRVENSERVNDLIASGRADLGFVEGARAPAALEGEIVATDELLVVCTPSHPWARRDDGIRAEELAGTRLVVRERGAGGRQLLELRLAELGLAAATPAAEIASPNALRAAVLSGVAPGVVSDRVVGADLASGRLQQVRVPEVDLRRDLRAVWRPGARPVALDRMLG